MSKLGLAIAVLIAAGSTARAHAPGETTATDLETEVNDTQYQQCLEKRKQIAAEASQTTDLQERARRYQSMPECHSTAPVAPAPVAPAPVPQLDPADIPEVKSPSTALTLSLGTTAVGWGLLLAGGSNNTMATVGAMLSFVGPTTGHMYADEYWDLGLGARILGVAVAGAGLAAAFAGNNSEGLPVGLLVTGGLLYVGGSLYEIGTAPQVARDYNLREARSNIKLVPTVSPTTNGISLVGSF